jgi:hypothetical protein
VTVPDQHVADRTVAEAAGLRPKAVIRAMTVAKQASDLQAGTLAQRVAGGLAAARGNSDTLSVSTQPAPRWLWLVWLWLQWLV